MITTDAPAWLRRSDQAVTWARTMLTPRRRHRLRDNRSAGRRYRRVPWWTSAAGSFSTPRTCILAPLLSVVT
jgi:hypothetical protein